MARSLAKRNEQKGKPAASSRKANAVGYAKRHTRKAKAGHLADVYEHQQEKVRRDKVKLAFDREELAELGLADNSDDERVDHHALRARLIGENVDNETIDPEDDEEIDSDAAFDEGDEEQFAGSSFRIRKRGAKYKRNGAGRAQQPEIDLNEDMEDDGSERRADNGEEGASESEAEEEEEGDPDEFFDVLDVLDGRGADALEESAKKAEERTDDLSREKRRMHSEDESEEIDSDEEKNHEDETDIGNLDVTLSADDEDIDEDAVEDLNKFVLSLEPSAKRKAEDDTGDSTERRKRRIIAERTQTGPESEFTAYNSTTKLQLDDLLAPLTSTNDNVLSLRKSAKTLASTRTGKVLSAPLALRAQERLDREAAYEQTKAEVDKWNGTMKQIKEAEHLSFPLQAAPAGKTSNLELAAKFQPTTALETSIDKLLKKAQMREEDLAQTETLKMNHLPPEEIAARRAEVRKTRELMFRAEVKAKRMAKIKSKTYRRIKKKARERQEAEVDSDSDGEEARMKHEIDRAKERATLRHKATGKWAKSMRNRGELDEEQRQDVLGMLDRSEKLRRKIHGQKDSDASDEESSEDEEAAVDELKARAFEELEELRGDATAADLTGSRTGKSVFDMKFMRDAAAREQREVDRQIDDIVHELGGDTGSEDGDGGEGAEHDPALSVVERVGGRMSFRPGPQQGSQAPIIAAAPSDASSSTLKTADLPVEHPIADSTRPSGGSLSAASNPWLAGSSSTRHVGPKRSELAVGKHSAASEKSKDKLGKKQRLHEDELEKAREDAVLEIDRDDALTFSAANSAGTATALRPTSKAKGKAKAKAKAPARLARDNAAADDSHSNSEVEEQERLLSAKGKAAANGPKAFEQRDLVAMAFAGDNVVQEFEEAKQREIDADAPKEVDTTLPGWGSWGGTGVRKQAPKPWLVKKVAGVDPTARADHGKKHVIVSERRDKKAAKYLVKDLPYPYTSKAQFERSLATPIGTEWNTRVGFQRATLPRITKKMGVVIDPLQKRT